MAMLRKSLLVFILILSALSSIGQIRDKRIRQLVLRKGITDRTFIFGKWSEKGGEETHLRYLGKVTTQSGRTFKIVNSSWFWGLSHRATSRILLFNERDQYLGNYYLDTVDDLPVKLKDGDLIFRNMTLHCDKNYLAIINLKKGLPKLLVGRCKVGYGNEYYSEFD